jgi:hypothetical protein
MSVVNIFLVKLRCHHCAYQFEKKVRFTTHFKFPVDVHFTCPDCGCEQWSNFPEHKLIGTIDG